MDVVIAGIMLLALAPVLAVIAVAIRLASGSPVVFRQLRAGRHRRPFVMYKFRTMVAGAERGALTVTREDPRLTRLGYWLRTFSLDELPQLVNVLRGDMSLVGPRPLLPEQLAGIGDRYRRRLDALPGMTNLPAIHGRNTLSFPERMALDTWYVDHWSVTLDCRILLRTLWVVFRGDGVYAPPGVAAPPRAEDRAVPTHRT
jgi:lipopolysaccharide/colanic/teichoic acid biosynthesis glycosyltransferase